MHPCQYFTHLCVQLSARAFKFQQYVINNVLLKFECPSTKLNAKMRKILTRVHILNIDCYIFNITCHFTQQLHLSVSSCLHAGQHMRVCIEWGPGVTITKYAKYDMSLSMVLDDCLFASPIQTSFIFV